jgi:hypothetical protein
VLPKLDDIIVVPTIVSHVHLMLVSGVLSHTRIPCFFDFFTITILFLHPISHTSFNCVHHLSFLPNYINKTIMAPWDATEDRALLLSVISVAQVNPNWEDVAAQLGKTKEAVRYGHSPRWYILPTHIYSSQRFAKLKKEAGDPSAATATNTGAAAAAPAATPTPRKRKPKAKAKKAASDDEDEDEGTPLTKKFKKIIKNEDEDEDEDEAWM